MPTSRALPNSLANGGLSPGNCSQKPMAGCMWLVGPARSSTSHAHSLVALSKVSVLPLPPSATTSRRESTTYASTGTATNTTAAAVTQVLGTSTQKGGRLCRRKTSCRAQIRGRGGRATVLPATELPAPRRSHKLRWKYIMPSMSQAEEQPQGQLRAQRMLICQDGCPVQQVHACLANSVSRTWQSPFLAPSTQAGSSQDRTIQPENFTARPDLLARPTNEAKSWLIL